MCESLNITVQKTIAEFPSLKGLSEHLNAVLDNILLKVSRNKNIAKSMHLQWIINANRSFLNVHGFSPYQ